MPKTFHRIPFLAFVCVAVSIVAGSPFPGLAFVVAQVITPPIANLMIGCLLLTVFLLEGRDAALPLTLVASRTFIVGTWALAMVMLWFITTAITPKAYKTVTAAFNVTGSVVTLACRQWKAGRSWPSPTGGTLAKVSTDLKAMFAKVDKLAGLKPKVDDTGVEGIRAAFHSAANDAGSASCPRCSAPPASRPCWSPVSSRPGPTSARPGHWPSAPGAFSSSPTSPAPGRRPSRPRPPPSRPRPPGLRHPSSRSAAKSSPRP